MYLKFLLLLQLVEFLLPRVNIIPFKNCVSANTFCVQTRRYGYVLYEYLFGQLGWVFFHCADEMLQMVLSRHHAIRRSWDFSEVLKKLKSNDMIVFQNLAWRNSAPSWWEWCKICFPEVWTLAAFRTSIQGSKFKVSTVYKNGIQYANGNVKY